jgi:hypothetical protein
MRPILILFSMAILSVTVFHHRTLAQEAPPAGGIRGSVVDAESGELIVHDATRVMAGGTG